MELIKSSETVTINGKTIPKVYGGFSTSQPAILAKQVAEIHQCEVKQINRIVTNNLDWFDESLDYIDLKPFISGTYSGVLSEHPSENLENLKVLSKQISKFLIKSGFYPNTQAIGGTQHIYLFSKQGYAMLCKLLKSETAKKIYKQMVRDYFKMAEIQESAEKPKIALQKKQSKESENYWFSGKLAEVLIEAIQENRLEINQILLELREQSEEIKSLKDQMKRLKNDKKKR